MHMAQKIVNKMKFERPNNRSNEIIICDMGNGLYLIPDAEFARHMQMSEDGSLFPYQIIAARHIRSKKCHEVTLVRTFNDLDLDK